MATRSRPVTNLIFEYSSGAEGSLNLNTLYIHICIWNRCYDVDNNIKYNVHAVQLKYDDLVVSLICDVHVTCLANMTPFTPMQGLGLLVGYIEFMSYSKMSISPSKRF